MEDSIPICSSAVSSSPICRAHPERATTFLTLFERSGITYPVQPSLKSSAAPCSRKGCAAVSSSGGASSRSSGDGPEPLRNYQAGIRSRRKTSRSRQAIGKSKLLRRKWRRGSGSNRRIRVLQTLALPLGYRAGGRGDIPIITQTVISLHQVVVASGAIGGKLERRGVPALSIENCPSKYDSH